MRIEDIKRGDVLVSTDKHGTGYYRVRKVNRVRVIVVGENGNEVSAYPSVFDRKVTYDVPTLPST